MKNVKKITNFEILISHKKFYRTNRSFKKIFSDHSRDDLALKLSVLSFNHYEERVFRNWSLRYLCTTPQKTAYAKDKAIYSRLQAWRLWMTLLREWKTTGTTPSEMQALNVLHEAFSRLNDRKYEINDDINQAFIKAISSQSRDNHLSKLHRTQKLFLTDNSLAPFVECLQTMTGISAKLLINMVYFIVEQLRRQRRNSIFSMPRMDEWAISSKKISEITNIPFSDIELIMNELSFTVEQGRSFADKNSANPNEFSILRNKPFLRISDTLYLPIEGKLVEELMFENIFHRIHQACGKDIMFFNKFGQEFEKYARDYVKYFLQINERYEIIDEFSYGRDGARSPDIMIAIPNEKAMIVVEIKSARPLNESLATDNNPKSVKESLLKLRYRPWKQAYNAICKIITENAHPKISIDIKYFFICVTMNNFPMHLDNVTITGHGGKDLSAYFYSIDIETFELLVRASSLTKNYSMRDILLQIHEKKDSMSAKTHISRFINRIKSVENPQDLPYESIKEEAAIAHEAFLKDQRNH
ncbi:MAG: hypothetical protein POH28_04195 [Acidocella sp.]|nr:hypothetical protein [Acidocella sp.]